MDEKLYDIKEVADHFKVSTKTIRNWVKDGRLKGFRVGREWRFTNSAIKEVTQPRQSESKDKTGQ